jgi:hypothetical protein
LQGYSNWSSPKPFLLVDVAPHSTLVSVSNFSNTPYTVTAREALLLIVKDFAETEEAAKAKYDDEVLYIDIEGIMALFGGWTGVDMSAYADDDELKNVESDATR